MPRKKKAPTDVNALAAYITEEATGQPAPDTDKNVKAAEAGRKGGLKGGPARSRQMTPKERSDSARKAANARWGNPN